MKLFLVLVLAVTLSKSQVTATLMTMAAGVLGSAAARSYNNAANGGGGNYGSASYNSYASKPTIGKMIGDKIDGILAFKGMLLGPLMSIASSLMTNKFGAMSYVNSGSHYGGGGGGGGGSYGSTSQNAAYDGASGSYSTNFVKYVRGGQAPAQVRKSPVPNVHAAGKERYAAAENDAEDFLARDYYDADLTRQNEPENNDRRNRNSNSDRNSGYSERTASSYHQPRVVASVSNTPFKFGFGFNKNVQINIPHRPSLFNRY